jgi:hypothetical protein
LFLLPFGDLLQFATFFHLPLNPQCPALNLTFSRCIMFTNCVNSNKKITATCSAENIMAAIVSLVGCKNGFSDNWTEMRVGRWKDINRFRDGRLL